MECEYSSAEMDHPVVYGIMESNEMCIVVVYSYTKDYANSIRVCSDGMGEFHCIATDQRRSSGIGAAPGEPMPPATTPQACTDLSNQRNNNIGNDIGRDSNTNNEDANKDNISTNKDTINTNKNNKEFDGQERVWPQVLAGVMCLGVVLAGIAIHALKQRRSMYAPTDSL